MRRKHLLFIFAILSINSSLYGEKIYVDSTASGVNNGLTWVNAFPDFNDALLTSGLGDTICVAKGTYKPSAYPAGCNGCNIDEEFSFLLPDSVVLLGGFPNGGGPLTMRDWISNPTVLSGDIGTGGDMSDNVYHVITSSGSDHWTSLDGFFV